MLGVDVSGGRQLGKVSVDEVGLKQKLGVDAQEVGGEAQRAHDQAPGQDVEAWKAGLEAGDVEVDRQGAEDDELVEAQVVAAADLTGVVDAGVLDGEEEVAERAGVVVDQGAAEAGERRCLPTAREISLSTCEFGVSYQFLKQD